MNYRANSSARAMKQKRFNTIGFFVAKKRVSDYAALDTISLALVDAAEKQGQTVLLVSVPISPSGETVIPRSLNEKCLDAFIVQNAMQVSPEAHSAIESSRVPVVYMNEKAPTNAVYVDDIESGRIMTEFLIGEEFRKIAVLSPVTPFPHYSAADRVQGYLASVSGAGIEPVVKNFPSEIWRAEAREWLQSSNRPEVIFCTSDHIALQLQGILYELNIRVPETIAIAGCDDEHFARHSTVPLTTLHIPFEEMARVSVEQAMKLIETPGRTPSVVLHSKLVVRDSTRRRKG